MKWTVRTRTAKKIGPENRGQGFPARIIFVSVLGSIGGDISSFFRFEDGKYQDKGIGQQNALHRSNTIWKEHSWLIFVGLFVE